MPLQKIDMHFLKMAQIKASQNPAAMAGSTANQQGGGHKMRGCVIAKNNQVIGSGTSIHLGGEGYRPTVQERYVATVNAEIVAMGEAIKNNVGNFNEVTCYSTNCPNWYTFKLLVVMGIKRLCFYGPVTNERTTYYAKEIGVDIISVA